MDVHYMRHGVPFAWESGKAEANIRKHGVRFEDACEAFFDPFLRLVESGEHGEERFAFLGMTERAQLLFVVCVERDGDTFRIIFRKARHSDGTEDL